jgi:hypothetical protein
MGYQLLEVAIRINHQGTEMRFRGLHYRRMLCFLWIMMIPLHEASSTIIAVAVTKDGFWIGADGYRTSESGKNQKILTVCKIHQFGDHLLLKYGAGRFEDSVGASHSTDAELRQLLKTNQDWEQFKDAVKMKFKSDLEQRIMDAAIKGDKSRPLESYLFQTGMPHSYMFDLIEGLVVLSFENEKPVIDVLQLNPKNVPTPSGYRYEVAVYGWNREQPTALQAFPQATLPLFEPEWVTSHPLDSVKKYVSDSHKVDPLQIGPPYSFAHFFRTPEHVVDEPDGISKRHHSRVVAASTTLDWIEKGACPSWDETARIAAQ